MKLSKLNESNEIVNLFEKYKKEIIETFISACKREDIEVVNLDVVGIFDEILSKTNDEKFMVDLIDDIRNSVGVEAYGLNELDWED